MENNELQRAFQRLCEDYEDFIDEAAQATQPVSERIGLALFKIDEACAAADGLRQDTQQKQHKLLSELLSNCHELENIYLRVKLIERFVGQLLQTTRELEKRLETVSRAVSSVFYPSTSITSLFRSFSVKRGALDAPSAAGNWTPVAFDFNTEKLIERLEESNAQELGVSVLSSCPSELAPKAGGQVAYTD